MKIPHWKLRCFWSKILAFILFFLFVENFVTPFSTLANIKGSLPTNSTTPDRLRCRTKTDGEDSPDFWVRTSSKKSIFQRSGIYTLQWWSTPQKKPIAGFCDRGVSIRVTNAGQKKLFLARRACKEKKELGVTQPVISFFWTSLWGKWPTELYSGVSYRVQPAQHPQ